MKRQPKCQPTDPIVESVRAKFHARSARGLAKYGTSLADNHVEFRERIIHLQEELMDAANYCEWILQQEQPQ